MFPFIGSPVVFSIPNTASLYRILLPLFFIIFASFTLFSDDFRRCCGRYGFRRFSLLPVLDPGNFRGWATLSIWLYTQAPLRKFPKTLMRSGHLVSST
jgi:hypothetical protein